MDVTPLMKAKRIIQKAMSTLNTQQTMCSGCMRNMAVSWEEKQAHATLESVVTKLDKVIATFTFDADTEEF